MSGKIVFTKIIIRAFNDNNETIAIFPDIKGNKGMCMSYMHVGQHGECSWPGIKDITHPAQDMDLMAELERIGYRQK